MRLFRTDFKEGILHVPIANKILQLMSAKHCQHRGMVFFHVKNFEILLH